MVLTSKLKILDDDSKIIIKNISSEEYLLKIISMDTALLYRQANPYATDVLPGIIGTDELI